MGTSLPLLYLLSFKSPMSLETSILKDKWHKGAARAAQRWSEECMLLTHDNTTGRFIREYGSCGQNIFIASHKVPWLFAIKTWWLEKDLFTFGKRNNLTLVGHYTQMVWAATHEVGCGISKCNRYGNVTGAVYYNYVCNYCPIGNRPRRIGRPYRKGEPCKSCRKHCHHGKLCTNSCPFGDMWLNCKEMYKYNKGWLCYTPTPQGKERAKECGATCFCRGRIRD
ncbi:cysteine-rich secretory protein 2-like isoform X2 [Aethina tumida]|uniref:cysteine-rich secretory protein 2-like isoform X2 n=1 Tax=Aethina tumida TaxID=116153 RepID=UPI0021476C9F|nr:cysteine-rich secretory protein 2-like isoform X2 [Aethina tumida]